MTTLERYAHNFGPQYADSLITLGASIVKTMQHFKCDVVFGVGGDFAANIISALEHDIHIAPCGNEMNAAFTACGQAEITGIGFCLTTYTVGSLPCASAVALAKTEQLPVVFISGAPGEDEVDGQAIHHSVVSGSSWKKDFDLALNAYRSMGIRAERLQGERLIGQPNVAGAQFFSLIQHAILNREPVFIEIPRDLLKTVTQPIEYQVDDLLPSSTATSRLTGHADIANHIANKLLAAKQPLVYIGEKTKLNRPLIDLIFNYCVSHNIPFATSWFAKGLLDEHHPLSLGAYNGVFSGIKARRFIEAEVDYVLEIGTSIVPQDTNLAFDTGTHAIDKHRNKTVLKGTELYDVDLVQVLEALSSIALAPFQTPGLADDDATEAFDLLSPLGFHNLATTFNHIQAGMDRSMIYLPEVGNSYFASFDLVTQGCDLGRSWLSNPWYAAMGTSLCYARAVALRIKKHQLSDLPVVITGDGGFHFQSNELIHLLREGLSLTLIYMRNDIFHLGKSSDAEIYQCATPAFDLQKLTEAYGGRYLQCCTPQALIDAMADVANTPMSGLRIIEVPTSIDPELQSPATQLLNLYIQAKNANPVALREWQAIKSISQG